MVCLVRASFSLRRSKGGGSAHGLAPSLQPHIEMERHQERSCTMEFLGSFPYSCPSVLDPILLICRPVSLSVCWLGQHHSPWKLHKAILTRQISKSLLPRIFLCMTQVFLVLLPPTALRRIQRPYCSAKHCKPINLTGTRSATSEKAEPRFKKLFLASQGCRKSLQPWS
ncbi:uncharacterized protein LY89DRAFT_316597 [Mollisia scopiformis]|uniref:Uncharacterized protein n=1 Tax=Mollisia scopiformis TaxID=149040 RepID=A0A132BAU2_MOLSC|nr:uncharacterized protein LY89DRAFT_316597 [Mollisia scopiformis]KUJ08964.1 hypothetical protein LY89DRAFT_316597 [Mollisia scopiformis]